MWLSVGVKANAGKLALGPRFRTTTVETKISLKIIAVQLCSTENNCLIEKNILLQGAIIKLVVCMKRKSNESESTGFQFVSFLFIN